VSVDGLTLSGNARHSLLIDGDVTGSLRNVSLENGDESLGIVQQRSSVAPSVDGNTPAITSVLEQGSFDALPVTPQAPSALQ
jgi:hypothetical protein